MRKYFEIITKPETTFQYLMENDDGRNGKRINILILLTILLPIVFAAIYDIYIPFDPNSADAPVSMRILGYIFPAVFGTLIGFGVFKFLIPFLINSIGQSFSDNVDNINQTRFIVAFSLIPIIIISPLRVIYFIENEILLTVLNVLLQLASLSSIIILFSGVKLIYRTDLMKTLLIISPYIILALISIFIGN